MVSDTLELKFTLNKCLETLYRLYNDSNKDMLMQHFVILYRNFLLDCYC